MALVGYGAMVSACLAAADMLAQQGVSATVVDARFCKPLDVELLRQVPPLGLVAGCPADSSGFSRRPHWPALPAWIHPCWRCKADEPD